MKTLSVLLGVRERLETNFKNMLDDMFGKFKNKQGLFLGERKTYNTLEGFADDPTKRGFTNVASTVKEQLDWFNEHSEDYFNTIFNIEATNASGKARANLIIDGKKIGEYSSLELLRLKSILENPKFKGMIDEIPTRSLSEIWVESTQDEFLNRNIYETNLNRGFSRTTLKESYILPDSQPNRTPQVAEKSSTVNVGEYTTQNFSGAISQAEKAQLKVRIERLYQGVIQALEEANNIEIEVSDLGLKVLTYLF